MTKTKEAYRGEDTTIEMIRNKALDAFQAVDGKNQSDWVTCWKSVCVKMAVEMEEEGLVTTAEKIKSFISTSAAKQFQ